VLNQTLQHSGILSGAVDGWNEGEMVAIRG
jgi:hypothetical protein